MMQQSNSYHNARQERKGRQEEARASYSLKDTPPVTYFLQ
jgi:hypothetical protein